MRISYSVKPRAILVLLRLCLQPSSNDDQPGENRVQAFCIPVKIVLPLSRASEPNARRAKLVHSTLSPKLPQAWLN